ncbi:MAG: thermonuclease family protein [Nitrosopumilaceae archaeon]
MIKTLLILFSSLPIIALAHDQQHLLLPIVSVYDGDTIKTKFPLPFPLDDMEIRILGIDTPEMPAESYLTTGKLGRAKCKKEAELAITAKNTVKDLAKQHDNTMIVKNYFWDKYGSRINGDVYFGNVKVAEQLLKLNMAVPYFGGTKTKNWCL